MRSKIVSILAVILLTLPLMGCRVQQTEEGELPKVEVEGGKMPEYDVDAASIEVQTTDVTVKVPTDIDINMPGETPTPSATPPQ